MGQNGRQLSDLDSFIQKELAKAQPPAIMTAAAAIRKRFGSTAAAVLFYGSCLRAGETEGKILDFYVIVDDYREAYGNMPLAAANKILPPNVFYAETGAGGEIVRSKYAVLSMADLRFRTSDKCLNVSVWARFSQPACLVYARDAESRCAVTDAVSQACLTMIRAALPFVVERSSPSAIWQKAFSLTYGAELRSEGADKGRELYLLDQARYDAITPLILSALAGWRPQTRARARRRWRLRRWNGKTVSILRLMKAAFTFDGGIDYIAWKVKRHSGVEIEITPWRRRHPVLAGALLFLRLRRRGAFR